jgi:UDP-2,3-diacylglucosamine pyrophosphatase LpxH/glycosyltransferase involved in cell wall biosynthesis
MRIDIVTDTFAPDINGVSMTLGRLCDGLRVRGHRVHVIRSGEEAGCGETPAASFRLLGYKEVRVGLPRPFKLRKRWLRKRPDAIYVATESPLGKSAVKAAKVLGIPVVTGFHTNFHEYIEQYRFIGLQPVAMAYLRRFHARADRTLVPSPDMLQRLVGEGFENVHLLGRGVDCALFNPESRCERLRAEWGARPGAPVGIVVGRVALEKNLDLAMNAFAAIRAEIPDFRAVVVGDGPIRPRLEQKYPWAQFAGVQTGEDLARHYASADFLLFPSETETFGNVLLEGMASGLVTLGYDYAAAELHVDHGVTGLKVEKGNAAAFLTAAAEAARLAAGSHLMRSSARQKALTLGWDAVCNSFEGHLEAICRKSPAAVTPRALPFTRSGKRPVISCRSVFLSDIHLGTPESKTGEVVDFLKHLRCEKLILNGDIIDGWALRRGNKWRPRHSRVIRKFLKMAERDHTEVIYLRGNHDDILERFLPLAFGRVKMAKEYIHAAANGLRYLVVHGDGFDSVSTNHRWLAWLGAVGYDTLLKVNRHYNRWRSWRGLEHYSLSKRVKARVKSAVSFVDQYEELLQNLARQRKCDGIICGHIHTPENKQVGRIHYLNSGDWVESLTAIIEHDDGTMELVYYHDFISRLHATSTRDRDEPLPYQVSGPVRISA